MVYIEAFARTRSRLLCCRFHCEGGRPEHCSQLIDAELLWLLCIEKPLLLMNPPDFRLFPYLSMVPVVNTPDLSVLDWAPMIQLQPTSRAVGGCKVNTSYLPSGITARKGKQANTWAAACIAVTYDLDSEWNIVPCDSPVAAGILPNTSSHLCSYTVVPHRCEHLNKVMSCRGRSHSGLSLVVRFLRLFAAPVRTSSTMRRSSVVHTLQVQESQDTGPNNTRNTGVQERKEPRKGVGGSSLPSSFWGQVLYRFLF